MPKILVAEDDEDIRELITVTLRYYGFEVVSAIDGTMAVALATSQPFDLILLDVRMPGLDGFQVCTHLKSIDSIKDIPIVFLSAKGQKKEIQTGLAVGASRYILKPFAPLELVKSLQEVLAENELGNTENS